MAHAVFISHATEDKEIAQRVCVTLEQAGLPCWIAPRDIRPGTDWGASIVAAIRQSKAMVVIFSEHANSSRHIPREVIHAVENEIEIIPFRIENVTPRGGLDYSLSSLHWLDAVAAPIDPHLHELARLLRLTLSPALAPEPIASTEDPAKSGSPVAQRDADQRVASMFDRRAEDTFLGNAALQTNLIPAVADLAAGSEVQPTSRAHAPVAPGQLDTNAIASERGLEANASLPQSAVDDQGVGTGRSTGGPSDSISDGRRTSAEAASRSVGSSLKSRTMWEMPAVGLGALAVAGLIGLMISQNSALPSDLGFDPSGVAVMEMALPTSTYKTEIDANRFFEALMERLRALPGIDSVGGIDADPLREATTDTSAAFEPLRQGSEIASIRRVVAGDYFKVLRIPLPMGRYFTERDGSLSEKVVLISESLAAIEQQRSTHPIGRRVTLVANATAEGPSVLHTVVGVVGNMPHRGHTAESRSTPHVYLPASQNPVRQMTIVARTTMSADRMAPSVRTTIHGLDAQLPVPAVMDSRTSSRRRCLVLDLEVLCSQCS